MKKLYTTLLATVLITSLNAQTSLTFDGVDDYVDCGSSTLFELAGNLTVEAKVKTTTSLDYYPLINNLMIQISGYYKGYWLGVDQQGYPLFFLGDASTIGDGFSITGTTLVNDGQWHHLSGVVTGVGGPQPTAMIYVDGVLETTFPLPNTSNILSSTSLYLGTDNDSYYHQGEIDNVRLWSRDLSAAEIAQNKDICLTGTENGLIALYQFETGSGTNTAWDVTSNGNNGTMVLMDQNTSWVTGYNCAILVTSITVQGQGSVSTITTSAGTLQIVETVLPANATDNSVTWSVANGTGSATINPTTGLLAATGDGTVTVTATANDGSGITGSTIITISNQTVGITEINKDHISIYPNPNQGIVNLNFNDLKDVLVSVYNVQGKLVYEAEKINSTTHQFELNGPTGLYLIKISAQGETQHYKVMKR